VKVLPPAPFDHLVKGDAVCPACLTTAALAVAGATTTGRLTALVVKK
jgi:hypothetical protein